MEEILLFFEKSYKTFSRHNVIEYLESYRTNCKINPITNRVLNEKMKKKIDELAKYENEIKESYKVENFFEHQIQSADKLFKIHEQSPNIPLVFLNDEAGCGKTITYLLFIKKLKDANMFYKTTVICDNAIVHQWVRDILSMKFTYKKISVIDNNLYTNNEDILIISSELLQRRIKKDTLDNYSYIFGLRFESHTLNNPNMYNIYDFKNKRYICFDELYSFNLIESLDGYDWLKVFLALRHNLIVLSADKYLLEEKCSIYYGRLGAGPILVKSNSNFIKPEILKNTVCYSKNKFLTEMKTTISLKYLETFDFSGIKKDFGEHTENDDLFNIVVSFLKYEIDILEKKEKIKCENEDLMRKKKRLLNLKEVYDEALKEGCIICCQEINSKNAIFMNCCLNVFCSTCVEKLKICPLCRGDFKITRDPNKIQTSFFSVINALLKELTGKTLIITTKKSDFFVLDDTVLALRGNANTKQRVVERYFNNVDKLIINSISDCHGLRLENTKNIIFEPFLYNEKGLKISITEDLKNQIIKRAVRINRAPNFTLNIFEIKEEN